MVGDVISGVKFLFDAIRTKNDKSQDYRQMLLVSFIEPIYNQLEAVHKQYLESFQNYRTLIETTDQPLNLEHPIFDLMQKDHALSDMDRAKLVGMSEHLNTFKSDVGKEMFKDPAGRFAQEVIDYVATPAHELTQRWGLNAPRKSLLVRLEGVCRSDESETEKKKFVIRLLDEGVERLQKKYVLITRGYMELKANLLA